MSDRRRLPPRWTWGEIGLLITRWAVIVLLGMAAWRAELPIARSGPTIHLPAWGRILVGAIALGATLYEAFALFMFVRRSRTPPPGGFAAR